MPSRRRGGPATASVPTSLATAGTNPSEEETCQVRPRSTDRRATLTLNYLGSRVVQQKGGGREGASADTNRVQMDLLRV